MTIAATEAMRCSAWARAEALDPIGSAGTYDGFLLIELPLPWPRDLGETDEIASLTDVLAGRRLRVQALVPGGGDQKVVAYQRDPQPFGRFTRFAGKEAIVAGDLRATVSALLTETDADSAHADHPDPTGRDVLVCTHGRRDVCCGSLGSELWAGIDDAMLPAGTRRWRTSHTGGHRFAPTFIVLPEATAWAFADADLIYTVLNRGGEAAAVADHYRGCSGLTSPRVQALEREVLKRVGWDLLDRPRHGAESGNGEVWLEAERQDGGVDTWTANVSPGRQMLVPDCMKPIEAAKKSETEWIVSNVALTSR